MLGRVPACGQQDAFGAGAGLCVPGQKELPELSECSPWSHSGTGLQLVRLHSKQPAGAAAY